MQLWYDRRIRLWYYRRMYTHHRGTRALQRLAYGHDHLVARRAGQHGKDEARREYIMDQWVVFATNGTHVESNNGIITVSE